MKMVRKALVLIMMVMMAFTCVPLIENSIEANALSTGKSKKMTVYSIIKKGKYVYCVTYNGNLYRVNIKTGKKKCIEAHNSPWGETGSGCLKIYKGYLYYGVYGVLGQGTLYRVKTNGKNKKLLESNVADYAISKNKIYYTKYGERLWEDDSVTKWYMKLNGKNKKKGKFKVVQKFKRSNVKGYKVKRTKKNGRATEYLICPNRKKIKLCNYESYF